MRSDLEYDFRAIWVILNCANFLVMISYKFGGRQLAFRRHLLSLTASDSAAKGGLTIR